VFFLFSYETDKEIGASWKSEAVGVVNVSELKWRRSFGRLFHKTGTE
jgi:hypothetical protein